MQPRMFEETGPSVPVYQHPMFSTVTEMEKIMNEFFKFVKDHFTQVGNEEGLVAVKYFTERVNEVRVSNDLETISQICNYGA